MLTYILMLTLVAALTGIVIYGISVNKDKDSFMSVSDTTFLRGFWCIIVVLVHIPAMYQNQIQDMVGSFAYIGVTFFFMTSAYGLKYSITHKNGYMEHFWRRRLPPILVPALIANAFVVIMYGLESEFQDFSAMNLLNIDGWVKILLLFYIAFWLIYCIAPKFIGGGYLQDIVMCLFVVFCSLMGRFTELKITSRWIVEPLGFAYGIIAAEYSDKIRKWMKKKWLPKCAILMVVSMALGIAYLKMKPIAIFGDYILKILLGLAMTSFIFEAISCLTVGNKVNSFLGDISYEVYLLHRGVFAVLAIINTGINSGLYVILSILLTVAFAFLLNKVSRPIIRLLR